MDKVYRLLSWMDINQAVDWLQDMTATQLTDRDLLQLCEARQCHAYADVDGLTGENFSSPDCQVAKGIHLVKNPLDAFASGWEIRTLFSEGEISGYGAGEWTGELPVWKRGPIFKPSEIEALAAKMNGTTKQNCTDDTERQPQQLEAERSARLSAEERVNDLQITAAILNQRLEATDAVYEDLRIEHRETQDKLQLAQHEIARLSAQLTNAEYALRRLEQQLKTEHESRKAAERRELQYKAEAKPSVLLAAAALKKLLESPIAHPRPQGMNQAAITAAILERFPGVRGLSSRNLDEIFGAANKAMSDAE